MFLFLSHPQYEKGQFKEICNVINVGWNKSKETISSFRSIDAIILLFVSLYEVKLANKERKNYNPFIKQRSFVKSYPIIFLISIFVLTNQIIIIISLS